MKPTCWCLHQPPVKIYITRVMRGDVREHPGSTDYKANCTSDMLLQGYIPASLSPHKWESVTCKVNLLLNSILICLFKDFIKPYLHRFWINHNLITLHTQDGDWIIFTSLADLHAKYVLRSRWAQSIFRETHCHPSPILQTHTFISYFTSINAHPVTALLISLCTKAPDWTSL